ncbi:MAG: hypothetical protein ACKESB_00600 [Candidatus Hodgkinia cicadicola]
MHIRSVTSSEFASRIDGGARWVPSPRRDCGCTNKVACFGYLIISDKATLVDGER